MISAIATVVLAIAIGSSACSAALISFSDQTFSPTNWSLTSQYAANGGTASAQQNLTGGDTGADWQVNISVASGNGSAVFGFSLDNAATYTPSSQGAITLLTYGEYRNTAYPGQEFGPALMQDNIYYYAYQGSGASSGWESDSGSFTSTSFGTSTNGNTHPNFTSTGDKITFGFVSINNSTASSFSSSALYDNWTETLTTVIPVPEPVRMLPMLLSLALLLRGRREPKSRLIDAKI